MHSQAAASVEGQGAKLPNMIRGPDGRPLGVWDLPSSQDGHWTRTPPPQGEDRSRCARGLISTDEVLGRYGLTLEELEIWQREFGRNGNMGLRVTLLSPVEV